MLQLGKLVVCLLLWCLTYTAGIEYHQVGLIHTCLFPTQFLKHRLDALGIGLVHLATNSPDMIFPTRNTGGCGHRMVPLRASMVWTGRAPAIGASTRHNILGLLSFQTG